MEFKGCAGSVFLPRNTFVCFSAARNLFWRNNSIFVQNSCFELSSGKIKRPWLADPSATYRTRGQSVPCFAFESVIISLFPVWSQHFTSSSDFQILATAPISKVFGTLPYRNWYLIAIFINSNNSNSKVMILQPLKFQSFKLISVCST